MELLNGKRLQWALYRLERHSIDFVSEVDGEADEERWAYQLIRCLENKKADVKTSALVSNLRCD